MSENENFVTQRFKSNFISVGLKKLELSGKPALQQMKYVQSVQEKYGKNFYTVQDAGVSVANPRDFVYPPSVITHSYQGSEDDSLS